MCLAWATKSLREDIFREHPITSLKVYSQKQYFTKISYAFQGAFRERNYKRSNGADAVYDNNRVRFECHNIYNATSSIQLNPNITIGLYYSSSAEINFYFSSLTSLCIVKLVALKLFTSFFPLDWAFCTIE